MEPYPFTDSAGHEWHVFDYRMVAQVPTRRNEGVPIGDWRAEARA